MIKTYVFLDVETTGLPKFGKYNLNPGAPKITELALVAVSSQHFLNCARGSVPRIQDKLVKVFHPQRFIGKVSERSTGLSNDLLESQRPFDLETCDLIIQFLTTLAQPVCLIAHNGYRHDFPLLQAHIKKFGTPLPETVLCCDSLDVFRDFKVFENSLLQFDIDLLEENWIEHSLSEINELLDNVERDHFIQLEKEVLDWYEEKLKEEDCSEQNLQLVKHIEITEESHTNETEKISRFPIENNLQEKTPIKPIHCNPCAPVRKARSPRDLSNINPGVCRQLFPTSTKIADLQPSYRLSNIYYHFFKKTITNAHSAEADCIALLKCLIFIGPHIFKNWVDENHKRFSSIMRLEEFKLGGYKDMVIKQLFMWTNKVCYFSISIGITQVQNQEK